MLPNHAGGAKNVYNCSMSTPLLATKLYLPPLRPNAVPRTRLILWATAYVVVPLPALVGGHRSVTIAGSVKRDGTTEPYLREKVVAGISKAIVNRPVTEEQVLRVVDRVEGRLRRKGPQVPSEQVGLEILAQLAKLDQVAYMRFASVYKDFQGITDFEKELGALQKKDPAKARTR